MQEEESIYQLIPKTPIKINRPPKYRSKYPYTIPPSYSTLCTHTTSKPGVANVGGDWQDVRVSHPTLAASAIFGSLNNERSLSPSNYLKKGVGPSIVAKSLDSNMLKHHCQGSKPKVPSKDDPPIHGLKSHKNFIVANAVENILAGIIFFLDFKDIILNLAPAISKSEGTDWLKKKDYAKIPNYLLKVKEHLQVEYETIREHQKKEEEEKMKEK